MRGRKVQGYAHAHQGVDGPTHSGLCYCTGSLTSVGEADSSTAARLVSSGRVDCPFIRRPSRYLATMPHRVYEASIRRKIPRTPVAFIDHISRTMDAQKSEPRSSSAWRIPT